MSEEDKFESLIGSMMAIRDELSKNTPKQGETVLTVTDAMNMLMSVMKDNVVLVKAINESLEEYAPEISQKIEAEIKKLKLREKRVH